MKKISKRKEKPEITQDDLNVLTLLQSIKQQLVFLEKKIDAISNSQPQERRPERPSFGHDRGDREGGFNKFKAICAECGQECEVPFKPMGSRPVYCRDCFSKREGGSFEGRRDSRPRTGGFRPEHRGGHHFAPRPGGDRGFGKKSFGPRKKRF